MYILWLTPHIPYPIDNGSKYRIMNVLQPVSRFHDITLVSFCDNDSEISESNSYLSRYCSKIFTVKNETKLIKSSTRFSFIPEDISYNYSEVMSRLINKLIDTESFHVIIIEHLKMAQYLPEHFKGLTVLSQHNVEFQRYLSFIQLHRSIKLKMWSFIQFLKLLLYEYCLIRKFNLCITVSEKDLKTLKLLGCTSEANFLEVPIGVNVLEYRNFPSTDYKKYHLSFCGAMSYGPNKDAILYFNDKILPFIKNVIPNIKILIIGSNPPKEIMELPKETYTITGYVKDIKKYLSQSSVFISPLRMGGGSKVKIIQAMACGLPVVTTQQGAQGLQIINGKHIIIADKPKVFAKSTIRLLNDNNLYKNISISGQSLAFSRYDINRIADNFCSSLNLTYNNLQNS